MSVLSARGPTRNALAPDRSKIYGLDEVVGAVREAAEHKQYRDDPVLVTMKVLAAARMLSDPY